MLVVNIVNFQRSCANLQTFITCPCSSTFPKNCSRDVFTLLMIPFFTSRALDHTHFVLRHAAGAKHRDVYGPLDLDRDFMGFARKQHEPLV